MRNLQRSFVLCSNIRKILWPSQIYELYDIPFLNEINSFMSHKPFCGTENTVEWWLAKVGRFPFDSSMSRRGTYFGSWGDFFAPIQYVLL